MAHDIEVTYPAQKVKNKDIVFTVRQNGTLMGRVKISKGNIDWFKPNAQTRTGRASWAQFKAWMEDEG